VYDSISTARLRDQDNSAMNEYDISVIRLCLLIGSGHETESYTAKDEPAHLGDLVRLQQSLTAFGESTRPESTKPVKPSVLA